MTTFDRRSELLDISEQHSDRARAEHSEHRQALRYNTTGFCGHGRHVMRRDGCGGGACTECPETVSREEM